MKDSLRSENEKYKTMRLSSIKPKTSVKTYWVFYAIKKFIFFLCMYKMYLISAKGYKNVEVDAKIVRKTGEISGSMKDVGSGMGVKNIYDLILKELFGIYDTINLTKEQIKNAKWLKEKFWKIW